jgi:EAL domain-containing protein (putative c-di-GMP-specific phosphodiesterase class I)
MNAGLRRRIRAAVAPRVVLTLSELAGPGRELAEAVRPLRGSGARIALTDLGADLGGLSRLVEVWPEFARIDRALTDRVEHDPTKHAVVAAVVGWAEKAGAAVNADGVRSAAQLDDLAGLGVHLVQGDLVGEERHLADLRSAGPRALAALVRASDPVRAGPSTTARGPALVAEGGAR